MHSKINFRKASAMSTIAILTISSIVGLGIKGVRAATFTVQDVALHSTASDCWLIISNKVYNVTSYIPLHPGGTSAITSECGKDATAAFPHSASFLNLLSPYLIGDLVETPVLTSVTISPTSANILTGTSQQFIASPKDQNGTAITATLSWSSNNPTIASVNTTGLVTGLSAGTAIVTVNATNGTTTVTRSAIVTVTATPILASVIVSPATTSIFVGGNRQLSASPRDQNNAAFSGATIAWSSNDIAVATVSSSGLVTGVATGSATIIANATNGSASASGTALIIVSIPAPTPPPPPPAPDPVPPPTNEDDDDDEEDGDEEDEDEDEDDDSEKKDKDKSHKPKIKHKYRHSFDELIQRMIWKWQARLNNFYR